MSALVASVRTPFTTIKSALVRPVTASLKVMVTRLVSPALSALSASTMVAVGASVSTVIETAVGGLLVFPALSRITDVKL